MTIAVFLNAEAGTMRRLGANAARRIEAAFAAEGVAVSVTALPAAKIKPAIERHLRSTDASGQRPDAIIVGGGDGTVGSVAGLVAGTGIALGILPLGTLNHFARDLHIPQDVESVAALVAGGHRREVDIAEVNGRAFVNNSSIGIYPFLVAQRAVWQKRHGLGKLAALSRAVLRLFRRSSWQTVTVVTGSDRRQVRTPCVFIGNNLYDLEALGRRPNLDRGTLCIYIVKPQTWLGLIALPFKVALGLADPTRDVEFLCVPEAEIRSRHGHLRVALDGEAVKLAPPLHYRIRPLALSVFAPGEASSQATNDLPLA
jgi:diacylglycerol kinase family enzyme